MAFQPSQLLAQILGDSAVLSTMKKGGLGALLGETDVSGQSDGFKTLLASLGNAKSVNPAALVQGAGVIKKTGLDALVVQLTPEFMDVLKGLSADDLQKMPVEIAAMFLKQLKAETTPDEQTSNLIAVLSALPGVSEAKPDLFKIIHDPKLAAFLAGLKDNANGDDEESAALPSVFMLTSKTTASTSTFAPTLPGLGVSIPVLNPDAGTDVKNIADLNLDEFNALKKLAFADLAPFLTQPRLVRLDNNTVMKVAQGPSFLNDQTTDSAILAAIAGLMPVIPQSVLTAAAGLQTGTAKTDAAHDDTSALFLDSSVLASAIAQQTGAGDVKPVKSPPLFASLLGIQTAHGDAQAQTAPTTPVVAPNAQPATPVIAAEANHIVARVGAPEQQLIKTLTQATTATTISSDAGDGFNAHLHVQADVVSPSTAANTLLNARAAPQPHPATYMVSVVLQRSAAMGPGGSEADRRFVIQLDPESLGRVKITLEFGENNSVKAKLLAERPETISMLQKDAGLLERALQNSGFDTKAGAITFDLAQGDSFSGALDHREQQGQNGGKPSKPDSGMDFATLETVMPIFVDPKTGLTHVNVVI